MKVPLPTRHSTRHHHTEAVHEQAFGETLAGTSKKTNMAIEYCASKTDLADGTSWDRADSGKPTLHRHAKLNSLE